MFAVTIIKNDDTDLAGWISKGIGRRVCVRPTGEPCVYSDDPSLLPLTLTPSSRFCRSLPFIDEAVRRVWRNYSLGWYTTHRGHHLSHVTLALFDPLG